MKLSSEIRALEEHDWNEFDCELLQALSAIVNKHNQDKDNALNGNLRIKHPPRYFESRIMKRIIRVRSIG